MQTAYVLIVIMSGWGSDGGNAVAMQKFDTYAACVSAGDTVKAIPMKSSSTRIDTRCSPVS